MRIGYDIIEEGALRSLRMTRTAPPEDLGLHTDSLWLSNSLKKLSARDVQAFKV